MIFDELGGDLPIECEVVRSGQVPDLTLILVIGDVEEMMTAILICCAHPFGPAYRQGAGAWWNR